MNIFKVIKVNPLAVLVSEYYFCVPNVGPILFILGVPVFNYFLVENGLGGKVLMKCRYSSFPAALPS